MFTCWLLPATTARRTQHLPLKAAYGIHLLSAVVAPLLCLWTVLWVGDRGLDAFLLDFEHVITRDLERNPLEFWAAIAGTVLGVEAGFVLLALLLAPWGAADEPVWASIRNGLRQTWLHTSVAIPLCVLLPILFAQIQDASRAARSGYWAVYSDIPYPNIPYAPPNTPGAQEFQRAQEIWQKQINDAQWGWRRQHAFYENFPDELCAGIFIAAMTYVWWAMLRAIGAKRDVPAIARPPMCEECGYNLVATPMDSRCPECGRPVEESLGPQVRPGAPWEHRRAAGRFRAWWRTSTDAILRPRLLGRKLRVSQRVVDHRPLLAGHAVAVLLMVEAAFILGFRLIGRAHPAELERMAFVEAAAVAAFLFGVMLALPLLAAATVGLILRWKTGRNLLPAAMQAANYLSPFLVACIVTSGLLFTAMVLYLNYLERQGGLRGPAIPLPVVFCLTGWLSANVLLLAAYCWLLYKAAIQARFANR